MPKQPARKTAALADAISSAQEAALLEPHPTKKAAARAGRIMYIECKAGALTGEARIARVRFSQTGRTLYYRDHKFQSLKGKGFKSNYYDVDTGEDYWISGPKRDGGDAYTVAAHQSKLTRTFGRSTGEMSDGSQKE
jgi:hypothetical protein